MIPIRLIIHNFRAIEHADIDLSAVSLAAIAGRNGAGKSSAFTIAPRYALFGDVISGVSLDDLVRRGASDMSVTFEFEHQGNVYRAIRTRSTKGKGKSTLELQKRVNGQWESRSAEKIVDTEAVIRNLLNLDDETFTASSMILQGQANAFTGATAGKRKEILSQILGLHIYEKLQECARQQASSLHIDIEKMKDKMLLLEERIAIKPIKEQELLLLEAQHISVLENIKQEETTIKLAETELAMLDTKKNRIEQINKELFTLDEEQDSLQKEKVVQSERLERAKKILENEENILEKSAELEKIQQQILSLETRKSELTRIQTDFLTSQTELQQLDDNLVQLDDRITKLQQELAGREALREQYECYEKEIVKLRDWEVKADTWNLLSAELSDISSKKEREESQYKLKKQRLTDRIAALEEQATHLHDSGCLPTCKYQQAAALALEELPKLQQILAALDRTEIDQLAVLIANKQMEQEALGYDYAAHRACKVQVDLLVEAVAAYAQLSSKEELLQQLKQQQHEKQNRKLMETKRLDTLQEQLLELEQSLAPLVELHAKVTELERWAKLKDQIAVAREIKVTATERLASIAKAISAIESKQFDALQERDRLMIDTLDYERIGTSLIHAKSLLQEQREQLTSLAEQIGGIKVILQAIELDQQEHNHLVSELEPKALRWTRYQTLIKAFGRDGIPALIIENAVPQLERIANEILGQMSKGKHYVRFETQRELKSRAGVTETLDILIGDWTSERPYETFSGGEQLRIDYAIRFALAELLAQRAGSKVEWLTIDEGLGSQDAEHRALVLESIKSVASRFKRVLVITHIEDAQAAFDQVIRFDNDDGGVEILVA
ncbi:AAA family ATPase [Paenibacillus yanchengensis]|uniref:Nuclease SbcCD subunit C n=1 Tax=Paenibacillus yanchengensis TaxID=2035833 RepID=A0ABW4YKX2_9BACL